MKNSKSSSLQNEAARSARTSTMKTAGMKPTTGMKNIGKENEKDKDEDEEILGMKTRSWRKSTYHSL
jgi:hypothetical protein